MHQLYVRLVQTGIGSLADSHTIRNMVYTISHRQNVDTVLLAGTDFAVLEDRSFEFSHIDCFDVYKMAVFEKAASLDR